MKEYFQKKSFKILCIVVGILFLISLFTLFTGGFVFPNLLGAISTPMQKVSTMVANNAQATATNLTRSYEDLLAENQALKEEINSLNSQLVDYYQMKQENEQLRNFLELKSENKDYQLVAGSVVGRDPNDVFYSFRVDQGSLAGVSVNDPVITEAGLVGWVSSVSSMYCNVTTILSADTNISAVDKASRDSGIVTSDLKLADKGLIRLGLLEADNQVKAGDIIVTSGIGGIFPKNLPIGKAVEVKNNTTDVSLYATIEPFVNVKTVKDVLIITDFEGQGEALSTVINSSSSTSSSSPSSAASSSSSSSSAASSGSSAASSAASGGTE